MDQIKIGNALLELIQGDITEQSIDCIVNAANTRLAPGGGVAGAIHQAAGPKLWQACKKLKDCTVGEAKITKAYQLPCRYVIHTVGPIYTGRSKDAELLSQCYQSCFTIANNYQLYSIAFPALSTGIFGYPMKEAAEIALQTSIEQLEKETTLHLTRFVLYDTPAFHVFQQVLKELS